MADQIRINGKFPAWKGADVFEGSFENAKRATIDGKRNFQSRTVPLFAQMPPDADHPESYMQPIEDRALFRGPMEGDPQRRYIATVSPQYTPVQHIDVAEALGSVPKEWPLCMIGSTGKFNTRVFWGFDAGTFDLLGRSDEQHQQYIYVDSENDGGSSIHMMGSVVRMSCLNMYPLALKNASFYVRLRHGAQALTDVQQWTKYFHRLQEGMRTEITNLERMASVHMTTAEAADAFLRIFNAKMPNLVTEYGEDPKPGLPDQVLRAQSQYANLLERTRVYRVAALEQFEKISDESPAIAGSAYAAFNSVTFLENWRQGRGGEGAVESVMFGERAKVMQKARDVLLAVS